MKKLLIGIIIVLILILTGITIVKGFQIGSVEILGIMNIKDENEKPLYVLNSETGKKIYFKDIKGLWLRC